jgi:hypothetical protein
MHVVCMLAGNDMIGALGAEIDRLEYEIKQAVPGIRHIDLVGLQYSSPLCTVTDVIPHEWKLIVL